MQGRGGTVVLSGIHQQPLQMLRKAGFIDVIGRQNFCPTFDGALARAKTLLTPPPPEQRGTTPASSAALNRKN